MAGGFYLFGILCIRNCVYSGLCPFQIVSNWNCFHSKFYSLVILSIQNCVNSIKFPIGIVFIRNFVYLRLSPFRVLSIRAIGWIPSLIAIDHTMIAKHAATMQLTGFRKQVGNRKVGKFLTGPNIHPSWWPSLTKDA